MTTNEDVAVRRTYRYLRLGMISAVVLLGSSVLIEHGSVNGSCWQTSVSAYYYTPVRAVFVGALVAIGLSLVVIKGNTRREDVVLNVAGMLAPVVGFVPTRGHGTCWSIRPTPLPTDGPKGPFRAWVVANIDNNMHALLYAAAFGLIAAVVVAAIAIVVGKRRGESRSLAQALRGDHRGTILGLAVTAAILAAVWITVEIWDGYTRYAHFTAAVAMFAALAVAVEINARDCYRVQRISYARLYRAVACLMTASAVILVGGWDYEIFAVEVAEITLFAIFWLVQTRELWHNTVRSEPVDV